MKNQLGRRAAWAVGSILLVLGLGAWLFSPEEVGAGAPATRTAAQSAGPAKKGATTSPTPAAAATHATDAASGRRLEFGRPGEFTSSDAEPMPEYPWAVPPGWAATMAALRKPIDVDFDGVPLTEALAIIGGLTGLRIDFQQASPEPTIFKAAGVAAGKVLESVVTGLAHWTSYVILDDGRILVGPAGDFGSEDAAKSMHRTALALGADPKAVPVEEPGVLVDEDLQRALVDRKLTVDARGLSISDMLQRLGEGLGTRVAISSSATLDANADLAVSEGSLDEALRQLSRNRVLDYYVNSGTIFIAAASSARFFREEHAAKAAVARAELERLRTLLAQPVDATYTRTPVGRIAWQLSQNVGMEVVTDQATWESKAELNLEHTGDVRSLLDAVAKETNMFWVCRQGKIFLLRADPVSQAK